GHSPRPSATAARLDRIGNDRGIRGWVMGVAFIVTGGAADESIGHVPRSEVKCPLFVKPLQKPHLEACRLEELAEGAIGVEDMMILTSGTRPARPDVFDVLGIRVKAVGNRYTKVSTRHE